MEYLDPKQSFQVLRATMDGTNTDFFGQLLDHPYTSVSALYCGA